MTDGSEWSLNLQARSSSQRPTKSAWEFSEQAGEPFGRIHHVLHLPLLPQASALLGEPQESQHEINIFYAKTTHRFRTVTVVIWIPQTCDLCLSCEHVRTTVPVSATKQTSLCVCGLCFPQPAQARAAPVFLPAPPSGPVALADCGL